LSTRKPENAFADEFDFAKTDQIYAHFALCIWSVFFIVLPKKGRH